MAHFRHELASEMPQWKYLKANNLADIMKKSILYAQSTVFWTVLVVQFESRAILICESELWAIQIHESELCRSEFRESVEECTKEQEGQWVTRKKDIIEPLSIMTI